MAFLSGAACAIVGILHVYFGWLEIVHWTTPRGRRIFGTTQEAAAASAVLAKNQGVYNWVLAGGLFAGAAAADPVGRAFKLYFLAGVVVVGVYGAWTVNRRIFWAQAAPGIAGLLLALAA